MSRSNRNGMHFIFVLTVILFSLHQIIHCFKLRGFDALECATFSHRCCSSSSKADSLPEHLMSMPRFTCTARNDLG
ncbi:hypothetical protein SISNIDRAFT_364190 [Sistotremastrum niveocremeum HHB9708]|uniref:Secreted protein n=1 Tax=Sistotremastrum niveocremeum HHB9708 TaxID=1314777 RepID=A0A164MAA8_9AGAM|nr:hypothetical protein SISNIDRAFT_364190 [Sistotremastrum niveocremeum HHB9708]